MSTNSDKSLHLNVYIESDEKLTKEFIETIVSNLRSNLKSMSNFHGCIEFRISSEFHYNSERNNKIVFDIVKNLEKDEK